VVQLSETEFALRFIPWLAGVASIPVVYFLARQFTGKIPAYVSAGLVALAPTQVRYSQELREYSLAFLLAALMILFFTRYLRENKIKDLIPMTVLMVIAVFTQYGLALLIIALNIIFLIQLFSEKIGWIKNSALANCPAHRRCCCGRCVCHCAAAAVHYRLGRGC